MAVYPEAASDRRVAAEELLALVVATFRRCGMHETDADLLADTLVRADLRGVHSHGVLRVPDYVNKLTCGGVDPRGRPSLVRETGGCLLVDGGNSMGQIGAQYATTAVIERAKTTGIAAAAVRGSNHCGAMAYFAMQALPHDMIGWATTNAMPTMAPWGGAERILGINPLAVAIPAGDESPIVHDAAFSATAHGRLRVYQQKGLSLPDGWALDKDGTPTTDPAAAISGLLLPIGGFKGTALAMIMGVLSSMLSGAAYGTELRNAELGATPGEDGHFLLAISIGAFEEPARFKARVDAAVRELHACRRAPGAEEIYAPGELEFRTEAQYDHEGIPLASETLAGIARAADSVGTDTSSFAFLHDLR